jgi:hypothetical protein
MIVLNKSRWQPVVLERRPLETLGKKTALVTIDVQFDQDQALDF